MTRVTEVELGFFNVIVCGLSRLAARGRAEKWIARNFVPHHRPHWRTLGGHKAQFESESGEYLHASDMQKAFEKCDIKVRGTKVYAKKLRTSASVANKVDRVACGSLLHEPARRRLPVSGRGLAVHHQHVLASA
jgi:hypothetical protein